MVECKSSGQKKINILLAEDNAVNQDVIFEMLSTLGCQVKVASNGKEALEWATGQKFDLILMDCQMPVMDGHHSTWQIRLHEKNTGCPHTPIIGITGRAVQGNYEKCKNAGMDDCLDKPFTIEKLTEIIFRWTGINLKDSMDHEPSLSEISELLPKDIFGNALYDCLDIEVIKNICMMKNGSMEILKRLVDIYLRNAPVQFLEIRKGIYEKNAEKIFQASHSLKSSSANVGAMALAAMSHKLEVDARSWIIEGSKLKLTEMESEYIKVADALKSIVENYQDFDGLIASISQNRRPE